MLMRMIYLEGRTTDEVSKLTGWNHAVIKVRAFRARAQLRKRYQLLMKETP
jgi:DNA-directed RNA polymerase specialized sigma24 family protein